jgi:uncharacterized damage-inducible protein DinB
MNEKALRAQLVKLLGSGDAHVSFERAAKGIPAALRGVVPLGGEHSAWQLVEHLRIAQADILEFCISRTYREKKWPQDYWPKTAAPRDAKAWTQSLAAIRRDRKVLQKIAANPKIDLLAAVPKGSGQTYLREILLVADHDAYHIGQLISLRRQLGIWN